MKRIGVITSGGDAAGMNAAIRSVVRFAEAQDCEVLGIRNGYAGLLTGDSQRLRSRDVGEIMHRGGTMLGTSRSREFPTVAGQETALNQLASLAIEGLVVIGGNGTQADAHSLAQRGVAVVGIASTIDNDLYGFDLTLGVDTALNIALEAIDRLKSTATSHGRAFLLEVMQPPVLDEDNRSILDRHLADVRKMRHRRLIVNQRESKTEIGFVRVSSDEQVDGLSLESQEEKIRQWCSHREYELIDTIRAEGESAFTDDIKKRPQFQRFLERVTLARPNIVIVYSKDRWARSLVVSSASIQLLRSLGVGFASVTEQLFDFTSPSSGLQLNILAAFAQYSSDMTAQHVRRVNDLKFQKGIHRGSVPFGTWRIP